MKKKKFSVMGRVRGHKIVCFIKIIIHEDSETPNVCVCGC